MFRRARLILLMFLLLLTACQQRPEETAEQRARHLMAPVIGADAMQRAHVEVRPSTVGWLVIFRNANASCAEGTFWPGACRFGSRVFRDVYACVERDWQIRQMGASSAVNSLGAEDLCDAPSAPQPATLASTAVSNP